MLKIDECGHYGHPFLVGFSAVFSRRFPSLICADFPYISPKARVQLQRAEGGQRAQHAVGVMVRKGHLGLGSLEGKSAGCGSENGAKTP